MGNVVDVYIQQIITVLTSPVGILAVCVYILLLMALVINDNAKYAVLGIMIWVSTLGSYDKIWIDNTLVFPLEQIRAYGRPITVGLLLALLIPTIRAQRGWRSRLILGGTVLFFLYELLFSARITAGGLVSRGLVGAIVYILIFCVLGYGLSRWIQTYRDVRGLLFGVMLTGALFVGGTFYQLILNRSAIVWNSRLFGTTGNPQHAGVLIALSLLVMCYLFMQERKTIYRLLLGATIGLMVLMLIWTGSRTGVLMAVIGLGLLFRARIGKLFVISLVCGLFLYIAIGFFQESTEGVSRLVSTENTRGAVWLQMIDEFKSAPLFGMIPQEIEIQENSYLSAAARTGMIGIAVLGIAMLTIIGSLAKLQMHRANLGEHTLLADLVTAGMVSLAVGAMFEGYLLGMLSSQIFLIYIYLAILAFLLDALDSRTGSV
jgi:O-antigen ligase/polysaccharide polymerase Wzy-like membrane protein